MRTPWRSGVVAASMLAAACANAEVKEFRLPTAADGEVVFLIDAQSRLPVPAKDDRAMVTLAAFGFLPIPKGGPVLCAWQYAIRIDPKAKPVSVLIEDERGKQLVQLVRDDHPEVRDGNWMGQEPGIKLDKGLWDAMNGPDPWILLRRITVTYADGSQSKLHQMVVETQPMRVELIRKAMDAMKAQAQAAGGNP